MKKKNLILDMLWADTKVSLDESEEGKKKYIISGPFMRADCPNGNNRIYPKEVCDNAINKLRPKVTDKQIKMMVDHPFWEGPSLSKVGALLLDISNVKEDGYAYYRAQVLDTTEGKNLKVIMDAGGKIGCSTRGNGSSAYDKDWEGYPGKYEVINPDYDLATIDFVDNPSVSTTTDYAQYENLMKRSQVMFKNIEEMKTAHPKWIQSIEEAVSNLTDEKITKLEKELTDSKSNLKSVVDSLKESFGDMFTVVNESKLVDDKNTEIKTLTDAKVEIEAELATATTEIEAIKTDAIKTARDTELTRLEAEDKDFFAIEAFKGKFESCLTAEEVKTVYDSNKALLNSVKEQSNKQADPKTIVDNKNDSNDSELNENDTKRLKVMNKQRQSNGLAPMTVEAYTKRFVK